MAKVILILEDEMYEEAPGAWRPTVAIRMITHKHGDTTFKINDEGTAAEPAGAYDEDPKFRGESQITTAMYCGMTANRLLRDGILSGLASYVCADIVAKEMQRRRALAVAAANNADAAKQGNADQPVTVSIAGKAPPANDVLPEPPDAA